jgi:2-polyprenyl-3-methyl-5-hydroxy-6-metoxy-1,4-benzoquinol methylase
MPLSEGFFSLARTSVLAAEVTDEALRDNLATWERWTEIHVASKSYEVESFRDGRRPIRVRDYEIEEVGSVEGKTLLHLQCHFGLDTLSWARLGANVTGADFSPAAIEAARTLATEVGIDAQFIVSNLYELPDHLEGEFDVVYTSRGVLGWLPDIRRWADVVAHFVKPGGFAYITEVHPVANAFDDENVQPGELRLRYPYWEHQRPLTFKVQGSYADRDAATDGLIEHSWNHSLGEVITALVDAGLTIKFLHEFDFHEWEVPFLVEADDRTWRLPGRDNGRLPLFFSLQATKPL